MFLRRWLRGQFSGLMHFQWLRFGFVSIMARCSVGQFLFFSSLSLFFSPSLSKRNYSTIPTKAGKGREERERGESLALSLSYRPFLPFVGIVERFRLAHRHHATLYHRQRRTPTMSQMRIDTNTREPVFSWFIEQYHPTGSMYPTT